jgi:hypothetical protein
MLSEGVYKGEDLLPSEKQIKIFNKKFLINMKKYDFKNTEGKCYYFSKKVKLGVFNERLSYR